LIASAFAYGNVKSVLRTVDTALGYLGPSPSRTIASFDPRQHSRPLRGFYTDSILRGPGSPVLDYPSRTETYGSLEGTFSSALSSGDADITNALEKILQHSALDSIMSSSIRAAN
jgi:hypothetical protein